MNQTQIGRFISACRKKAGLTQSQLAEQLGITDKAVSKWETGRSMPDVSLFTSLCDILGISLNELIAGEYITADQMKEKSEEVLMGVFLHKKRSIGFLASMQTVSSIRMGVGTAVLFVPSVRALAQTQGILVSFLCLMVLYAGLIGKLRYRY